MDFLAWLLRGNFVLLGAREYEIKDGAYRLIPGSGLGILADEERSAYATPVPLTELPEALRKRATSGELLLVDKANARSPVHRRERMDYVGVRRVTPDGELAGEARLLGLFTTQGLHGAGVARRRSCTASCGACWRPRTSSRARTTTRPPSACSTRSRRTSCSPRRSTTCAAPSSRCSRWRAPTVCACSAAAPVTAAAPRSSSRCRATATAPCSSSASRACSSAASRPKTSRPSTCSARAGACACTSSSTRRTGCRRSRTRELERDVVQLARTWDDALRDALAERFGAARGRLLRSIWAAHLPEHYKGYTSPHVGATGHRAARAAGRARGRSWSRCSRCA